MMKEASREAGDWEPGRNTGLAGLVAYQAGAVVSRTLINRKTGTVTLFAFDEGEGLSEHITPFDALLHVLEGEAAVTVAGNVNEMKGGDGVLLPAGKPHSVRAKTRFKMLLVMIR